MWKAIFSALVTVLLNLVGLGSAAQQTDSAAEAERTIAAMEAEFVRAALDADAAALERLWAADYQFTAPNGLAITRDAYRSMIEAKAVSYERLELQGLKVRVFGDAATATGRIDDRGRAMGHIVDGVDDFLTVYVKRDGRWQQVASHFLRVPGTTRSSGNAQ
jgi:ketosteroid isomerase-like protein